MNIGGTEKALLNLLHYLPKNYEISILLLQKKGGFLDQIPGNVTILEIENAPIINNVIQNF